MPAALVAMFPPIIAPATLLVPVVPPVTPAVARAIINVPLIIIAMAASAVLRKISVNHAAARLCVSPVTVWMVFAVIVKNAASARLAI